MDTVINVILFGSVGFCIGYVGAGIWYRTRR